MAGGRGAPSSPTRLVNRRLIIRPEAEGDLTEAALWYEERETGLGREFTREGGYGSGDEE